MTTHLLHAQGPVRADAPEGFVRRLLARWLFRDASVAENRSLAPGLHRITLEGAALRQASWTAGDKLQIRLGTGLETRTYTPIEWDSASGRTSFIAHALAWGPGSEWVRRARPGQAVSVFGPRKSLELTAFDPHASVLLGDETSIGLAAAWRPSHTILEAGHRREVHELTEALGLPATAISRQADDLHLQAMTEAMLCLAGPHTRFVLTGRARAVQTLLRALRDDGVAASRIRTKAYWADNKSGLD